jgi:hypothetical protein
MKIRYSLTAVVASLGLALVALPGQAAAVSANPVTETQLGGIQAGEPSNNVTAQLGTPEDVTNWMDGSHSLAYELSDPYGTSKIAYVDVDKDGKVTDTQIVER